MISERDGIQGNETILAADTLPQVLRAESRHSSIKLTVDTYTQWMPGKNREAMDRLPALETGIR